MGKVRGLEIEKDMKWKGKGTWCEMGENMVWKGRKT